MILKEENGIIVCDSKAKIWDNHNVMSMRVPSPFKEGKAVVIPSGVRICRQFTFIDPKAEFTTRTFTPLNPQKTHFTGKQNAVDFPLAVSTGDNEKSTWVYVNEEMLEANGLHLKDLKVEVNKLTTLDVEVFKASDIL